MKRIRIRDIEHQKSVQTLLFKYGYAQDKEIIKKLNYNCVLIDDDNKTYIFPDNHFEYFTGCVEFIMKESLSFIPVHEYVVIDGKYYSKEEIKARVSHENF
jgi:hypothetical protein